MTEKTATKTADIVEDGIKIKCSRENARKTENDKPVWESIVDEAQIAFFLRRKKEAKAAEAAGKKPMPMFRAELLYWDPETGADIKKTIVYQTLSPKNVGKILSDMDRMDPPERKGRVKKDEQGGDQTGTAGATQTEAGNGAAPAASGGDELGEGGGEAADAAAAEAAGPEDSEDGGDDGQTQDPPATDPGEGEDTGEDQTEVTQDAAAKVGAEAAANTAQPVTTAAPAAGDSSTSAKDRVANIMKKKGAANGAAPAAAAPAAPAPTSQEPPRANGNGAAAKPQVNKGATTVPVENLDPTDVDSLFSDD